MAENIVVMTLPTHSGTYEAFSKLKSAAGFDLNAAVIIERDADGIAHLAEGRDYQAGAATTGGSLIGMLVGMPALCGVVAIVLTPRGQKRLRRID
mgnify:CR=1 FL=1